MRRPTIGDQFALPVTGIAGRRPPEASRSKRRIVPCGRSAVAVSPPPPAAPARTRRGDDFRCGFGASSRREKNLTLRSGLATSGRTHITGRIRWRNLMVAVRCRSLCFVSALLRIEEAARRTTERERVRSGALVIVGGCWPAVWPVAGGRLWLCGCAWAARARRNDKSNHLAVGPIHFTVLNKPARRPQTCVRGLNLCLCSTLFFGQGRFWMCAVCSQWRALEIDVA